MDYLLFLLTSLVGVNAASSSWRCPDAAPTQFSNGSYIPEGRMTGLVGMTTYEVGSPGSRSVLIGIHDIFGLEWNSNWKEVADDLARGGYKVILPDFFDGQPWTVHWTAGGEYPSPEVVAEYRKWEEKNSWEKSVRPKLSKLLEKLKGQGSKVGLFGVSYGGRKAALASAEFRNDLKVVGRFTPAPFLMEEAASIGVPSLILGSNLIDQLDLEDYCRIVDENLGNGSCVFENFGEYAGFVASEGDWTNDVQRRDAERAVDLFKNFLCQHMLP